ncbi:MAG TPA: glycosidase [Trueperaceae bacterium]|nr:glycosidase [Trueperaceae bacterium]
MRLVRHPASPLLTPVPTSPWQSLNVFNPSVVVHQGVFHMHYRAQGSDYVSRIGYAVSRDGVSWNRLERPVLEPSSEEDARGVEDPRVTPLDGRFYMAYTAYGRAGAYPAPGLPATGITPRFAVSDNLITWEPVGPLVRGEDNKDHALFPARVGGRYLSFHRRPPGVWLAASDDLVRWGGHRQVFGPRSGLWDGKRVGAGGPPIATEAGWLMIYHGYDESHTYRLGAALLDGDEPWRVLKRPEGSILEPEEPWELKGDVPNVVFSCANPVVDGVVHVYYGGADRVIGLATAPLEALLEWVLAEG